MNGKDFKYEDFTSSQLEALKVKGETGIGISSIKKIGTVGLVDTYRITFTDQTYFDYEIKNGANGTGGASEWMEILGKPFESISADFSVENGELKVVGISPHIGENGHWYIGDTDTGVTAHGTDGYTPQKGVDYFDGEPGKNGKSAYEYAQEGGYTGTEEEFKDKLAMEYLTDVQIDGKSIVNAGVAKIPLAGTTSPGAVKFKTNCGIAGIGNEQGIYLDANKALIPLRNPNVVLLGSNYDHAIRYAMTDGKGAKWTDTEKTGAWSRLTSIKTAMDEVAVAGAHYYLSELTELTITLPDDALPGQEITVVWYNGETPATLAIAGNILDLDYVTGANSRSEISALWDGTYWSLISNEQTVPVSEVTTDET